MPYNLADLFEHAADAVPERTALRCDAESRTFAELDARTNRLASHLRANGIRPGDHVGIYGWNSVEWVESLLAVLKARAVPVNINYRYVEDELAYLFDNADLVGLVFEEQFAPRIAAVRDRLPLLRHFVAIADGAGTDASALGAVAFEDAMASGDPLRADVGRTGDDQAIIYTGGTTGMPKGVMWRGEDIFFALCGGIDPFSRERVTDEHHHAKAAEASPGQLVFLAIPPLMHGASFCGTLMQMFQGSQVVLIRKFDAEGIWRQVAEHRVNSMLITGDAMGRPLIEALETMDAAGEELDLTCLISLSSSAAVFSPTVKDRFLERFDNLILTDSIGSTEGGFNGIVAVAKGNTAMKAGGPTVSPGRDVVVLDEQLQLVAPGDGTIGRVARGGNIPLGYYKDETKTAETFLMAADGRRYAVAGDSATIEADGTITLLGRGSVCINTGGEKVYPEEVEQTLKAHPDVFDAIVVGVPDERWGQRVFAVVQPRPGRTLDLDSLIDFCRTRVAGYKLPRGLHIVAEVQRSPSGKPDYRWAKALAESSSTPT